MRGARVAKIRFRRIEYPKSRLDSSMLEDALDLAKDDEFSDKDIKESLRLRRLWKKQKKKL